MTITNGRGGMVQKSVGGVPEIWTRFHIVDDKWLVLKMCVSGSKLEIAVPISNVLLWLRALFNLIQL